MERPLRLNFQASAERLERLEEGRASWRWPSRVEADIRAIQTDIMRMLSEVPGGPPAAEPGLGDIVA